MFEVQVDRSDRSCTVCRPIGDLDAFTVSQFRHSLAGLASVRRLVIDLGDVPFLDFTGLGALMSLIRHVRDLGGEVAVASPRQTLTRDLHASGFDRFVAVEASADAARLDLVDLAT